MTESSEYRTEYRNRVYIHGGKYKGRYGFYMGKYGKVMCSVKLDSGEVKNVWLSSVTRMRQDDEEDNRPPRAQQQRQQRQQNSTDNQQQRQPGQQNSTDNDNDKVIRITKGELLQMLESVSEMKRKIDSLEEKLKQLCNL